MESTLCFAYGSNMLQARIRVPERAPSARMLGVAHLPDHHLSFDKRGADGSGKCNVAPMAGANVHGVVYWVAGGELAALDRAEGGYERTRVTVWMASRALAAETYYAQPHMRDASLLPFDWYHGLVLAGARYAGLPTDYVERLAAQANLTDEDAERRARHLALLT